MKVALETITPAEAQEMLLLNLENNRPVSRRWVNTIVDLMTRNEWKDNGESVKFQVETPDGKEHLIDGQHRLHAVIRFGKPVEMLVVRDLAVDTFHSIDAGRKRTASDVLAIAGYKQSTTLAAAARLLFMFEKDHTFSIHYKQIPSVDIMHLVQRFPEIEESVTLGHKGRFIVPGSFLVFMHFLVSRENPDIAADFMTKLTEGVSMIKGDPVLTFRDRMFRYKAQNLRLRRPFMLGLLFKTWNYYVQGQQIDKLRFAVDEPFPVLAGFDRKALFGSDYEETPDPSARRTKEEIIKPIIRQSNMFENQVVGEKQNVEG